MRLPWRRNPVPDEVRGAVQLLPGEQVVAADRADEGYVVVSDRALHLLLPSDPHSPADGLQDVRIGWELVDRASWNPPALELQLRRSAASAPQQLVVELDHRSDLPAVVRDRVTASIVVNERIELERSWVRVVARRIFDTGELTWRLLPGPGADMADPTVGAAVEGRLEELRSQWEM